MMTIRNTCFFANSSNPFKPRMLEFLWCILATVEKNILGLPQKKVVFTYRTSCAN